MSEKQTPAGELSDDQILTMVKAAPAPDTVDAEWLLVVRAAIAADRALRPAILPPAVMQALRFYANGDHFHIDGDCQEFDTVSGEPDNWQMSQKDDDCSMLEDGTIAKKALTGELVWVEGDDDDAPAPVAGEIFTSAK